LFYFVFGNFVMYFLWLGGCIEFLIIILVFRMGVVKRIVPRSQLKIKKKKRK